MLTVDIKTLLALLSVVVMVPAYYPYLKDILQGKTKPHIYTWLIWVATQITAAAGLLHGGGGIAVINILASSLMVTIILLLSIKYGTKNITKSDTAVLVSAVIMIFVWWRLDNLLLAVIMAAAIDGLGYIPTLRKSYSEPWSETTIFWLLMIISGVLAVTANAEYNILTVLYLATITTANAVLLALLLWRRKVLRPEN